MQARRPIADNFVRIATPNGSTAKTQGINLLIFQSLDKVPGLAARLPQFSAKSGSASCSREVAN
jgi:hypothetical protein